MSLDLRWILTSCQTHLIISGQVSEDQLVSCWILTLTSLQLDRVTKDKSVKMTYLLTCLILTSPQTHSHKCHASEDELFRWILPSRQMHLVTSSQ